jgi:hypothetical protein
MVARNKVVINGTLYTNEIWTSGFHVGGDLLATPEDLQEWATAIGGAITALGTVGLGSLANLLTNDGQITSVNTYYYPAAGPALYAGQADLDVPFVGSGNGSLPPQCSAVYTLLTALAGRRYRGRMYWPCLGPVVDTDGTQDEIPQGTDNIVALMSNICDVAPGEISLYPVVYSAAADVLTAVSSIRADGVIDTQRRRRNAMTASSTTTPYVP